MEKILKFDEHEIFDALEKYLEKDEWFVYHDCLIEKINNNKFSGLSLYLKVHSKDNDSFIG